MGKKKAAPKFVRDNPSPTRRSVALGIMVSVLSLVNVKSCMFQALVVSFRVCDVMPVVRRAQREKRVAFVLAINGKSSRTGMGKNMGESGCNGGISGGGLVFPTLPRIQARDPGDRTLRGRYEPG